MRKKTPQVNEKVFWNMLRREVITSNHFEQSSIATIQRAVLFSGGAAFYDVQRSYIFQVSGLNSELQKL